MADHLDAPGLMSPNMNARTDITDIYVFQKPGNPNKSILIANVNPLAPTLDDEFDDDAIYDLQIDTDGDAVAEIAFRFTFSEINKKETKQFATVRRATGADAAKLNGSGHVIIEHAPASFGKQAHITKAGDYKFFAGFRSDPFFFDLMGFLNNFMFTGSDFFIDKNVYSIVLEVPNSALGSNPQIGVWFRVLLPNPDGETYYQVDRMGHPALNTVFNHGDDKNLFNQIQPTQDRDLFEEKFEDVLESFGYDEAHADAIAKILLPDILSYNYNSNQGYANFNGRQLADDVIDISLTIVTNGQITTDMVGPHTDYLSVFPYVGVPH
ncbi:MAG TPA: DUF4331 family protein [Ktedonobacteraceae bacterium]|nr:DUF4331 family protein [Ktedonobacteraceae bacterium]